MLGDISGRHKAENNRALFVGTQINLNGIRFDSMPNPVQALENNENNYLDSKWPEYKVAFDDFFVTYRLVLRRKVN